MQETRRPLDDKATTSLDPRSTLEPLFQEANRKHLRNLLKGMLIVFACEISTFRPAHGWSPIQTLLHFRVPSRIPEKLSERGTSYSLPHSEETSGEQLASPTLAFILPALLLPMFAIILPLTLPLPSDFTT